jgi:succinyl-CoA synthetase alpha subunit
MTLFTDSGVIVQGITGREGRMTAAHMVSYGTRVVAGVTPGKGGDVVCGVPVFDSISDAIEAVGIEAIGVSVVVVPPLAMLGAGVEAIRVAGCDLVIATEGIPRHDALRLLAEARRAGVTVVGPNSVGVIEPGRKRKLGAIGGDRPGRAFVPGNVGVVSRSGGMTSEIGLTLKMAGFGVSAAVSVGGDDLIGLPPAVAAMKLQELTETRAICYFGEPGTSFEEDLASAISNRVVTVPVVALVAGTFTESLPEGTAFGHAAAMIRRGSGRPSEKRRVLAEAGAIVVDSLDEMADAVADLLLK